MHANKLIVVLTTIIASQECSVAHSLGARVRVFKAMNETSASVQKTSDTPLSSSSSTRSSPSEGQTQTSHTTSSSPSSPLPLAASKERLSSEVNEAIQKFEEVSLNEFQRLENNGIDAESAVSKIMHNLQQTMQQQQANSAQKQLREEEIEKIRELTGFDKAMATRVLVLRNELAQLKRKGAANMAVALSQLTERITLPPSSSAPTNLNEAGSPSQLSSSSGSHGSGERGSAGGGGSSKKRRRSQRFQSRKSRKTETGDQDSTIDETNVNNIKGSDEPSLGTDDHVTDDSTLRKRHWSEAELDQKPAKKLRKSSLSSSSSSSSTGDSPEFRGTSHLSDIELSVGSESSSMMDSELSSSLQTQPQSLWYSPNSSTHSASAFSTNPARTNSGTNASSIFGPTGPSSASTTTSDASIASSSSTSSPNNQVAPMASNIPFPPQFSTAARFPSIPNLLNTTTANSNTGSSNSTTNTSSTTTTTSTDSNNSIYNKSGIILGAGIDMTGL